MRTHIQDIFLIKPELNAGEEDTAATWQTFGFVNGGDIEVNENLKTEKAIGGIVRYYSIVEPSVSVDTLITPADLSLFQSFCLENKSFTILAGNPDYCVKFLGAFPSEISVDGKVGEALKVSVKFEVMDADLTTPPATIPTPTGSPFLWYQGVVTVAGNNYQVSEFKVSVKRNVKLEADFSARPAGKKRTRNLWAFGLNEVECSLSLFLPYTADFAADNISPVDVFIGLDDTKSITLQNMLVSRRRAPVKGGDDIWVLSLDLVGDNNSLVLDIE